MAYRASVKMLVPFNEGTGMPQDIIRSVSLVNEQGTQGWTTESGRNVYNTEATGVISIPGAMGVIDTASNTGTFLAVVTTQTEAWSAGGLFSSLAYGDARQLFADPYDWSFHGGSGSLKWGDQTATFGDLGGAGGRWVFSNGTAGSKAYRNSGTPAGTGTQGTRTAAAGSLYLNTLNTFYADGDQRHWFMFAFLDEQLTDADVASWMGSVDPVAWLEDTPPPPPPVTAGPGRLALLGVG